jgi:hypothetical protein
MKLNREWHQKHKMPDRPTLEQRIAWHVEHYKHCRCREIPDSLMKEIRKRKIKLTSQA